MVSEFIESALQRKTCICRVIICTVKVPATLPCVKYRNYNEGPVYLDDTRMTEQISLRMRIGGKEGWYPVVAWGTHWYEADGQWEVILEDTSDIEIHVETLGRR